MDKKFKRQRNRLKGKKKTVCTFLPIISMVPNKLPPKMLGKLITGTIKIQSSEEDQIIYTYERDNNYKILDVINVSQQTWVSGDWATVVRFDSENGFLHVHRKLSIQNQNGIKMVVSEKQKDDPQTWLTWAIDDIKKNFFNYKSDFLKRSNLSIKKEIDNEK